MKTRRKSVSKSVSKTRPRKFTKRWLESIDVSKMVLDGSDNNGGTIDFTFPSPT